MYHLMQRRSDYQIFVVKLKRPISNTGVRQGVNCMAVQLYVTPLVVSIPSQVHLHVCCIVGLKRAIHDRENSRQHFIIFSFTGPLALYLLGIKNKKKIILHYCQLLLSIPISEIKIKLIHRLLIKGT